MNCEISFYKGCMQHLISTLLSCNSGGVLCWWEDFWLLCGKEPKTWLPPWRMAQCTLVPNAHFTAEQQFLYRNIHQTKPGSNTEKQLRGQIWACSISLDNAHHSNIKGKHIKLTFKLKSHQVALNFIKVPCGSEAAWTAQRLRPQRYSKQDTNCNSHAKHWAGLDGSECDGITGALWCLWGWVKWNGLLPRSESHWAGKASFAAEFC